MLSFKKYIIVASTIFGFIFQANCQEAFVEVSGTASSGTYAPLWLSSNRQGIVSPYANSAYGRAGIKHDFYFGNYNTPRYDSDGEMIDNRDWHCRLVADVMYSQNSQQNFSVHQAFGELDYKKIMFTIGQKERQIDLRNNRLTSGGLSQGINAQPIPEVLFSVNYFSIPFTNKWWKMRGRIGYGMTTDGSWQKKWVNNSEADRYSSNILYHEKVLGWKFGDEERFPLVFEPSLLMMTQFGGTSYNAVTRQGVKTIDHAQNLNAFWHALWPMGSEGETDGVIKNAAGNTIGSYNFAITWHGKNWMIRGYYERVFEDQSMMTVQYGLFDHLAGFDAELPKNPYVSHFLVEHMSTKDQAGPLFHDKTTNIPESYTGIDNYYNHDLYSGWQNYGMTIGNPLLTSPIYNSDKQLYFYNNRVRALHLGIDGDPVEWISWRFLATLTRNWGTYKCPFDDVRKEQYFLAEGTFKLKKLEGLQATLGVGYNHGDLDMLGNNSIGVQLTIRKTFNFNQ